ncbi:MAG: hypothetical protein ABI686_08230 [Acidobacteriota bacterium]
MKNNRNQFLNKLAFVFVLIFSLSANLLAGGDKMTPEELTAKHLESIGTPEARAAMKSVTIIGTTKATFFGRGSGVAEGIAVVASEGERYLVAMKFNNPEYPFEKMGYDGDDLSVGFVSPGKRSNLGQFLLTNKNTFKRGIFSGVLSTSWELLNFNEKDAKLKYAGMQKIDGKKYHELEYNPRKGSELSISLFFDPETFRHVRTEYQRVISARQGASVDASAGQSETRYKLVEDFSDFKEENKLTLPHTYKIYLEILTGNGTTSYEWLMNLQKFSFNQPIDAAEFKVDTY